MSALLASLQEALQNGRVRMYSTTALILSLTLRMMGYKKYAEACSALIAVFQSNGTDIFQAYITGKEYHNRSEKRN